MQLKYGIVVLSEIKQREQDRMIEKDFEMGFYPYSLKKPIVVEHYTSEAEARRAAAIFLRTHRRCGFFVVVVNPGQKWQIGESLADSSTSLHSGLLYVKEVPSGYLQKNA